MKEIREMTVMGTLSLSFLPILVIGIRKSKYIIL